MAPLISISETPELEAGAGGGTGISVGGIVAPSVGIGTVMRNI